MRVRCVYLDVQIRTFRFGTRLRRLLIRERRNWRSITLSSRRISFRGRISHWSWTGVSSGCVIVILAATWPNRQLPRGGVRCARENADLRGIRAVAHGMREAQAGEGVSFGARCLLSPAALARGEMRH